MGSMAASLAGAIAAPSEFAAQCRARLECLMRRLTGDVGESRGKRSERQFCRGDELLELLPWARRLRFPTSVEQVFQDDYFRQSIGASQFAQAVGLILYAAFGVLDCWGLPSSKSFAWLIRYSVVCPIMAMVLVASFLPLFRKIMQPVLAGVVLMAGLGITAMIAIAKPSEPANSHYFAGLILVEIYAFTFVQLRLRYALIPVLITIAAYEAVTLLYQRLLDAPDGLSLFLNSNFFFLSAFILGVSAGYFLEYYRRRDFLQRRGIESDLDAAREVQQSLIPAEFPAVPGLSIAGMCRTSREVGGDYIDVLSFGPDRWVFVVADVSGKGAAAALLMSNLHAIICTLSPDAALPDIAGLINSHLHRFLNGTRYVTGIIAEYAPSARRLRYVNAGHSGGAAIRPDGRIHRMKSTGFPLGLFPDAAWEVHEIGLQAGSTLVLYTDGITDRENACAATYGEQRLLSLMLQQLPCASEELLNAIVRDNDNFARGAGMRDDSTLLLARVADAERDAD